MQGTDNIFQEAVILQEAHCHRLQNLGFFGQL